jgi:hypothetical protein
MLRLAHVIVVAFVILIFWLICFKRSILHINSLNEIEIIARDEYITFTILS